MVSVAFPTSYSPLLSLSKDPPPTLVTVIVPFPFRLSVLVLTMYPLRPCHTHSQRNFENSRPEKRFARCNMLSPFLQPRRIFLHLASRRAAANSPMPYIMPYCFVLLLSFSFIALPPIIDEYHMLQRLLLPAHQGFRFR